MDKEAAEVMGLLQEADSFEYTPSEPMQAEEHEERKETVELEWPDPKRARQEALDQEELKPLSSEARSLLLGLPLGSGQQEDVEVRSTADKRETDHGEGDEESRKVPRREGSPMSSGFVFSFLCWTGGS